MSSVSEEFHIVFLYLLCLMNASCLLSLRAVFVPSSFTQLRHFLFFLAFVWRPFSFLLSSVLFWVHHSLINSFGHIRFCSTSFRSLLLYRVLSKTSLTGKPCRVTLQQEALLSNPCSKKWRSHHPPWWLALSACAVGTTPGSGTSTHTPVLVICTPPLVFVHGHLPLTFTSYHSVIFFLTVTMRFK